jgi:hypothetical protein
MWFAKRLVGPILFLRLSRKPCTMVEKLRRSNAYYVSYSS